MSICASAADGAEATVIGPEIEALAQDIAVGQGVSRYVSAEQCWRCRCRCCWIVPPRADAEPRASVGCFPRRRRSGRHSIAGRRWTKKSVTDAARESLASLTKAFLKECAPESELAVLQELEENAQAAVSDLLTQAVEPQRQSRSSVAGVPVEEAEAELARAGAEEAADELRRDTVRLMKITDLAPSVLVKIKLGVRKSTQLKKVLEGRVSR